MWAPRYSGALSPRGAIGDGRLFVEIGNGNEKTNKLPALLVNVYLMSATQKKKEKKIPIPFKILIKLYFFVSTTFDFLNYNIIYRFPAKQTFRNPQEITSPSR